MLFRVKEKMQTEAMVEGMLCLALRYIQKGQTIIFKRYKLQVSRGGRSSQIIYLSRNSNTTM